MRWILGTALVAGAVLSNVAWSQECAATIEANDQMQFVQDAKPVSSITVSSSCDAFTLTLKHIGTLPRNIMGHNWVLTTTPDYRSVADAGQRAGAANHFVPPDDARVLAATELVGGGEETSISFDPSTLEPGEDYTYFCSFTAHYLLMFGKLIVE